MESILWVLARCLWAFRGILKWFHISAPAFEVRFKFLPRWFFNWGFMTRQWYFRCSWYLLSSSFREHRTLWSKSLGALSQCSIMDMLVVLYLMAMPIVQLTHLILPVIIYFNRKCDVISAHSNKTRFFLSHSFFFVRSIRWLLALLSLGSPIPIDKMFGNMCSWFHFAVLQALSVPSHYVGLSFWSLGMTQNVAYNLLLDLPVAISPFGVFCCVVRCGFNLDYRSIVCNGRLFSVYW